jgi:hypothetical protein
MCRSACHLVLPTIVCSCITKWKLEYLGYACFGDAWVPGRHMRSINSAAAADQQSARTLLLSLTLIPALLIDSKLRYYPKHEPVVTQIRRINILEIASDLAVRVELCRFHPA